MVSPSTHCKVGVIDILPEGLHMCYIAMGTSHDSLQEHNQVIIYDSEGYGRNTDMNRKQNIYLFFVNDLNMFSLSPN